MVELYSANEETIKTYWRHMLKNPGDEVSTNPVYLSCNIAGGSVTREITISPDKDIFIPVNPVVVSEDEAPKKSIPELHDIAKKDEDSADEATITIDGGKPFDVKQQKYRFVTEDFEVEIRPNPPSDQVPVTCRAVADGYYAIIKALPVGEHTIQFKGNVKHPYLSHAPWEQNVTYKVNVR